MSRIYLVIILVAVFLLILSLTRLSLHLRYRRRGKDDELVLKFSLLRGLFSYELEIPVIEMKMKESKPKLKTRYRTSLWPVPRVPRPVFKIKARVEGKGGRPIAEEKKKIHVPGPIRLMRILSNNIRLVKRYKSAIIYFLGRVQLRRLLWQTEVGAGDPSLAGFLTGIVWGSKGFTLSLIYRLLSPGEVRPVVAVSTSFEKACFNTMLDCIFEVRIGYIILTSLKALILRFKKYR